MFRAGMSSIEIHESGSWASKTTKNIRLVIISGLSGSGKSTALKAFEDIGFFCIDNLPATLLPRFLDLKDEISKEVFKIALVMDLRGKDFLTKFPKIYQEIKRKGYPDRDLVLRRRRRSPGPPFQPDPAAPSFGRSAKPCPGIFSWNAGKWPRSKNWPPTVWILPI